MMALITIASGCSEPSERPLQGYIEGEYVRVAAPFAGSLQQLAVARGSRVDAGAALFTLERESELAARREAEQRVQAADARVANLRSGKRAPEIEAVNAQLRQAEAARELSASNLKRQEDLFRAGFVSRAALDDARTRLRRDDDQVSELKASVQVARLPGRVDEIRAAEADARAARDALSQVEWRLAQRAVAAPAAGFVNDTYYVAGDWVPAGSPVVSLLPAGNVKARFYIPETALSLIRPGQMVQLSCDGCGQPIPATIGFIADRAEFTPPILYSKENRAKLVFLVEAKPSAEDAARLNPGQPVDVSLKR